MTTRFCDICYHSRTDLFWLCEECNQEHCCFCFGEITKPSEISIQDRMDEVIDPTLFYERKKPKCPFCRTEIPFEDLPSSPPQNYCRRYIRRRGLLSN